MKKKTHEEFINEISIKNPNTIILGTYNGNNNKILCKCKKCGYEWSSLPNNLLKGKSCIKCGGNNKLSQSEFIEKVKKTNPHWKVISIYKNSKSPIECQCIKCGHIKTVNQAANLYKNVPCKNCDNLIQSDDDLIKWLSVNNPTVEYVAGYRIQREKAKFRCKNCGYEWNALPYSILNGTKCPMCAGNKKITNDEFIKRIKDINQNIVALEKYTNSSSKISFECKKCGYKWKSTPRAVMNSKNGCPKCSGKIKKSNDEFIEKISVINPNIITLSKYININTKVKCQCLKCGYVWDSLPNNLYKGHGCPNCNRRTGTSLPEQAVFFYIKSIYSDAINGYKTKINNNEIDIFIPSKKIGIEYDGFEWHKNKQQKDINKYNYCKRNGIFLIRIREDNLNAEVLSKMCDYYIHSDYEDKNHSLDDVDKCIIKLFNYLNIQINIDTHRDRLLIQEQYFEKQRKDSLLYKYPNIAKEWNQEKNGNITPDMVNCGSNERYSWKCTSCGYEWETSIANRCSKNSGCPRCSNRLRLSHEEFLDRLRNKNPNFKKIILNSEYYNQKTKIECKCKTCGYEWKVLASSLLSGNGCPNCAGNIKLTNEDFVKKLKEHNENIICLDEYINIDEKLRFKCLVCGYEWITTPYTILSSKKNAGCAKCSKVAKKTNDDFLKELFAKHPYIDPIEEYKGANTDIGFKCNRCGNIWRNKPHNILMLKKNCGCPNCAISKRKRILCVENGMIFKNSTDALKYVGGKSSSCITECCSGRQKKAYGYHWKYIE